MIRKTENCLYCGEKMESITAKKKFCCDLHRVYWNREQKNRPELLGVLNTEKGITIINPDNGLILQDLPNPIKPKVNRQKIEEQSPFFKNDVERMFWEEKQKLKNKNNGKNS